MVYRPPHAIEIIETDERDPNVETAMGMDDRTEVLLPS
jgi:hypothetical protein